MDCTVYANYRLPATQRIAPEYLKRSGGGTFDASAAYSYEGMLVIADVLERAATTDPDAVVAAVKKTSFAGGVTVSTGPVVFNETGEQSQREHGDAPDLGQKPKVVWPKEAAEQRFVFPRPKV